MMILPVSNAFAPRRVEGQTLLTHRESLPGNAASFVFRYKAFYWQSRKVSTPGPIGTRTSGSPKTASIRTRRVSRASTR